MMEPKCPGCCSLCVGGLPHFFWHGFDSNHHDSSGATPGFEGRICAEGWPGDISLDGKAQILTMYRELFIDIGKDVCMLPQTVARIFNRLGPQELDAIYQTALDKLAAQVFGHHPDMNVGAFDQLAWFQPQGNWSLQDDMALTKQYLTHVVEDKTENDLEIIKKFAHGEEAQTAIKWRLLQLQREPYISNQQIIKIVYMFGAKRAELAEKCPDLLERLVLPDAGYGFDKFVIGKTMQSFLTEPVMTHLFWPKNIILHRQVRAAVRDCEEHVIQLAPGPWLPADESMIDWLQFFTMCDLRNGSIAVNPQRLLAEFRLHEGNHLLYYDKPGYRSSYVNEVLDRVLNHFAYLTIPQ